MLLWQYQVKAEPVVTEAAPDTHIGEWSASYPAWLPGPVALRPSGVTWTSEHNPAEGASLEWTPHYPDGFPPIPPQRPSGGRWTTEHNPAEGAALDWAPINPDWLVHLPCPRPDLAWSTFTPPTTEVDWLPCVWMQEGLEEAMVTSGTTAYQEQEADVLRLNGDPVTLNGEPIRVVS